MAIVKPQAPFSAEVKRHLKALDNCARWAAERGLTRVHTDCDSAASHILASPRKADGSQRSDYDYLTQAAGEAFDALQIVGEALFPSDDPQFIALHIGNLPEMCRDLVSERDALRSAAALADMDGVARLVAKLERQTAALEWRTLEADSAGATQEAALFCVVASFHRDCADELAAALAAMAKEEGDGNV